MEKYNHQEIEKKWQQKWEEWGLSKARDFDKRPKFYCLDMFPYPSGAGLHVGHPEGYTATDIISRYRRMNGYNVLHPMGWDAFGLPAENYAIKTRVHPDQSTHQNINRFREQIQSLGLSYDWEREVDTSSPEYYKWTQWFFLFLYKNGWAYRYKAPVNWCPSCQTVLANEQVVNGVCDRCRSEVTQKELRQWFFKITDFAEELLADLNKIDWPLSTKTMQRNWIGKSEGAEIDFSVILNEVKNPGELKIETGSFANAQDDIRVKVFTTRPDTIFGATYLVLAPEHPIIQNLKSKIKNYKEVEKYIVITKKKTERERLAQEKEKTGVELKGVKAINPANNEKIPIFIADYVLKGYGTGAIMAVPKHDARDFSFAKKYDLPIKNVIEAKSEKQKAKNNSLKLKGDGEKQLVYEDYGVLINSGKFNGLESEVAKDKIISWLSEEGLAQKKINYKLRDWLISRQRYWGAPIPIIYCEKCKNRKYNYIFLHGFTGSSKRNFFPWLKEQLMQQGHHVLAPDLPNANEPKIDEQVAYVLKRAKIDQDTIIVGHSLGGIVAMRIVEKIHQKIAKLVLVDSFIEPKFNDHPRPKVEESFDWVFDFEKIKKNAGEIVILADQNFPIIPEKQSFSMAKILEASLRFVDPAGEHFDALVEPEIKKLLDEQGIFPVPERDLPVKLPTDVDFMPHGESPLARSKDFHKVRCPRCGGRGRRESDTMDTFVCSSWYFFRYCDPQNTKEFAAKKLLKYWMPVDLYVGGAEHTVLHLLYSRFFTKALHRAGIIAFNEPFLRLRHQGLILAEDGRKMSKSLGNVINPDEIVEKYGADTMRMYEMFMGPFEDSIAWSMRGVIGVRRFLERVYRVKFKVLQPARNALQACMAGGSSKFKITVQGSKLNILLNKTIKKVSEDIENFKFNTAISTLMILVNVFEKEEAVPLILYSKFLILLSPFAPHLAEELWNNLGHKESIFREKWPEYNPKLVQEKEIELVIQVNGRVRARVKVTADISEKEARKIALAQDKIKKWIGDKQVKKIIFIPGKLLNIVI